MEQESMEKLGFTEDLSWETEEQEKKFLFDKIQKFKSGAKSNMAPPPPPRPPAPESASKI